jgi:regulator of RNase E activity RraA
MSGDALSADLVTLLRRCAVPTLNSVMTKSGLSSGHMQNVMPVGPNRRFIGRAVTLRAIPVRDELKQKVIAGELPNLQMEAFEQLGPDDVLVIDSLRDMRAAIFGDVMATYAKLRGAAAIIVDGCVSDREGLAALDIAVFARGHAASWALTYLHFVERNGPVGCDGIAVLPGDILVGDGNGVVVLPAQRAAEVAAVAAEKEDVEAFVLERLGAGASLMEMYPINDATRAAFRAWKANRS